MLSLALAFALALCQSCSPYIPFAVVAAAAAAVVDGALCQAVRTYVCWFIEFQPSVWKTSPTQFGDHFMRDIE